MENLVEYFITNFGAEKIWVAFLFLAIYYIIKKEPFKILTHYSEKKDRDHEMAKSLLEFEKLSKDANELLREHLERASFLRYYRINTYSEMRSALLKFHKKYQGKIDWYHLRRAFPFISLEGTKIVAKIHWSERMFSWVVWFFTFLVGAYSLLVVGLAVFFKSNDPKQLFGLTFAALVLLIAAMFFSTLNWPIQSAMKVQKVSSED